MFFLLLVLLFVLHVMQNLMLLLAVLLCASFLPIFAACREIFAHPGRASVDVVAQEEVVAFLRQAEAAGCSTLGFSTHTWTCLGEVPGLRAWA